MVLTASAGVLPLMLTRVQKSFYMAPALPLFALAIALASAPALAGSIARLHEGSIFHRGIKAFSLFAIAAVVVASVLLFGSPSRDADILHDVDRIATRVPPHSLVAADPALWDQWNLQCYLMRRHFISMDPLQRDHGWAISGALAPADSLDWTEVGADLRAYRLWKRRRP